MYTDAGIPSNEAAGISAISEDVELAIVAGYADVIWPCDIANALGAPFDLCEAMCSRTRQNFGFSGSGEMETCGVLDLSTVPFEALPSFAAMFM